MSISSDSAEQTIRLTLEGMEVVAKISGAAVKNIAVALYTISRDQKQTKGKTYLNNMLKSDDELKIFSIKKEDLKTFYQEAKSYGILYCALINRKNKNIDGMVDIMVRAKDAPKVNIIVERYNMATFDKASIQTEIEKEKANIIKGNEMEDNVPDIGEQKVEINEAMVDDIFAKPYKEQNTNQNPEVAKTEKNPPSEPSLKSKNNSEGVTKPVEKESVKKKLKEAETELKVETELKKAQKSKENITLGVLQQKNNIPKIEITNK